MTFLIVYGMISVLIFIGILVLKFHYWWNWNTTPKWEKEGGFEIDLIMVVIYSIVMPLFFVVMVPLAKLAEWIESYRENRLRKLGRWKEQLPNGNTAE